MRGGALAAVAALAPLIACGSDDAVDNCASCDAATLRGTVELLELDYRRRPLAPTVAQASFWIGELAPRHVLAEDDGTCQRWSYTPSFCDPACVDGACYDGVCWPFTEFVDAGTLTTTGLTSELRVEPSNHSYVGQGLADDLFVDDATVRVALSGAAGGHPAMTLTSRGTQPLVVDSALDDGELVLANGLPYTFRWTPAADEPDARVRVTLNSNNLLHGSPYFGIIECDVADAAGQVTIPAAMIEAFPETEAWNVCVGSDCPLSHATRYHRARAAVDGGAVELIVGSRVLFGVAHPAP